MSGAYALRRGVALARMGHVLPLGVYGEAAADLVDRLVPRALYLRDGGMLPTVLLDEEGRVLAEVTVVADDRDFVLLVDGLDAPALMAHVAAQVRPGEEVELRPMWARYELFAVVGPFAWAFMEAWAGPEILGLPFLSAVIVGEDICFRAGSTGEWGYLLLVPAEEAAARWSRLAEVGQGFEAAEVELAALDVAALENGFFVARLPAYRALTLPEAQLQWCVTPGKRGYVGEAAVAEQLAAAPRRRLTWGVADAPVAPGAPVDGGRGEVVACVPRGIEPGFAVLVVLDLPLAHPGADVRVGDTRVRTQSVPLSPNLSLALDPQVHRFAHRKTDFPDWYAWG